MYMNVQPNQPKGTVSGARAYARLGERSVEANRHSLSSAERETYAIFPHIDAWRVLAWLRERVVIIALIALVGALAGGGFAILSKPRFTSHADILVNPSHLQLVNDDLFTQNVQGDSQLMEVESKLRVLTGGNVLQKVVAQLDLANDAEFVPPPGWLDNLLPGSDAAAADPSITALRALAERVSAHREERSYMVVLSAWTHDAQKSVTLVNALVDAFKQELAQGESESAGQAAASLSARLEELRLDVSLAEDRVAAFKRENNLQATMGELTSERSVTEMTTKVLDAQARMIDAETRYNELLAAGTSGAASAVANASPTISNLRVQSAALKQQVDSLGMRLGPQHPTLRSAQAQLQAVEQQIQSEIGRILEAAKSELDLARSSYTLLNEQANGMRNTVFTDNEAQIQLRALQRDAEAKASIYEAFLERAGEANERQSLDSTNVRLVTAPVPAISRSYPPRTLVLVAAGGMAGLMLALAVACALGWLSDYRRLART